MRTIDFDHALVQRARDFSWAAHAEIGQTRKYTGEPYISHPAMVAGLVSTVPHTAPMLAAAWAHDVVEDTERTLEDVHRELGEETAILVDWLSDQETEGNRAARKEASRHRWTMAPADAQTIKVADLISNTMSIVVHDLKFAMVYLEEKQKLLEVLIKADASLRALAFQQLQAAQTDMMYRLGALKEPTI